MTTMPTETYLVDWNGVVKDDKEKRSAPAKKTKQKDSLLIRLKAGQQEKLEILVKRHLA